MLVIEDTTPRAFPRVVKHLSDAPDGDSRIGGMREELAVVVKSDDPRERYLNRDGSWNLAFQLQEHWAYWEGANPGHVERYNTNMETWIDDDTGELPGSAYGDRMRNTAGHDQIARAVEQLRERPETRRAIVTVHQPSVEDYEGEDVACTSTLHPFLRDGELHMIASIRSQDMYWGYPYDVANNQWLQEVMAGLVGADVGEYVHVMNSCHYYTDFEDDALSAAVGCDPVAAPDCRLDPGEFEVAWERFSSGLAIARSGDVPWSMLNRFTAWPAAGFYSDWLGVVSSYEQARFHGDPELALDVAHSYVDNDAWREWAIDYAEGKR